jgi:hypothetical protein
MRLRSKRGGKEKNLRRRAEEKRGRAYWERKRSSVRSFCVCGFAAIAGKLEFVRCILLGKAFFLFLSRTSVER